MSQGLTREGVYTCPVVFLPALSLLPPVTVTTERDCHLDRGLLQAVVVAATRLTVHWQQTIPIPGWVERDVAPLLDCISQLAEDLQPTALDQRVADDEPPNLTPQGAAQRSVNVVMAEACASYDRYFQVKRVAPMRFATFVGQVAANARNILSDLPYTQLDRAQLAQIIATIGAMFTAIQAKLPPAQQPARAASGPSQFPEVPSAYCAAWQQAKAQSPEWTERVAFYRWRVGHHFFDLCAIFCADALQAAEYAVDRAASELAACYLQQAERFLRGSTTAMWYAGDFPTQIYQQIIRPSMVMAGGQGGFSGDQNADYHCLKQAKQQLKTRLGTRYGKDLAAMPSLLHQALLRFHEADIEGDEQHLLIAAHKVGVDQSLAQKAWQAELPDLAYKPTALDILREMVERKRREFAH